MSFPLVWCMSYICVIGDLYFKIHNIEQHPEIIGQGKCLLVQLLSEVLHSAGRVNHPILSMERFSVETLDDFLKQQLDDITLQWQEYLNQRQSGAPRKLWSDLQGAKDWLLQMAPLKLVDGAWLGSIHSIINPFIYRSVTRDAWQVLSEEMGDGDIKKNHVYVYNQLLRKIGCPLSSPHTSDFIQETHNSNGKVWKAAVAQLLLSLLAPDFLPEALGFNLQFEMLTLETLIAAKELREIKVDPSYFTLHITIDNADTGHAAMASQAVTKYLALVKQMEGEDGERVAWKRVQAGFLLSCGFPADIPSMAGVHQGLFNENALDREVSQMFHAKCIASNRVHNDIRVTIGGIPLSTWLDPERFRSPEWQRDFIQTLSNAQPWVYRGDSGRSRLLQQLSWGGSMFGAFTHQEVETLRSWIDNLSPKHPKRYWQFTGRDEADLTAGTHNRQSIEPLEVSPISRGSDISPPLSQLSLLIKPTTSPNMDMFLPLWFTHICLLESWVRVPCHTATPTGCAVVRLLRAQYGLGPEVTGVMGMDEVRRDDRIDLIDIGMDMVQWNGLRHPGSLTEVLEWWPSTFAEAMLSRSLRPRQHTAMLFGLTQAFVHLHRWCVSSSLLSCRAREALHHITRREQESLDECIQGLHEKQSEYQEFLTGYDMGRCEIEKCFTESEQALT
ncbi:hypothetical protein BDV25DRAFT_127012 [Aspergillus avenaceus]|uniref:Iron-containing redox enzyme family protein n=1 Tax=Aspergillus avenaceus TaxID=36643 RepID=A0A5N6U5H3_ASPAV|nr:hypothetical protein BDV25DRAFT_127012 [Aspergillus avenaceus]